MAYRDGDTIAAISTPPGSGGIGIIRISGGDAVAVADRLFVASRRLNRTRNNDNNDIFEDVGACKKLSASFERVTIPEPERIIPSADVSSMRTYTMRHGFITDPLADFELIDECIVSVMLKPHSYTGENVVEINSHGGYAVLKRILEVIVRQGVRIAEPGEFTQRAFLNGRIDLTEAEAVSDIISAKAEAGRRTALSQMNGSLSSEIRAVTAELTEALAGIEVAIDYPEYDDEEHVYDETAERLLNVCRRICDLSATYDRGRIMRDGFRIALTGRPNAGKSSLMNDLLGADRAIVTDVEGTTRDTVSEAFELAGFQIILTDTAGLRDTGDIVEKQGIIRTYREIEQSDAVIYLYSPQASHADEASVIEDIKGRMMASAHLIIAVNKDDLIDEEQRRSIAESLNDVELVFISALEHRTAPLTDVLRSILSSGDFKADAVVVTNERQKALLDKAAEIIRRACDKPRDSELRTVDCLAYDVWECARTLGEITGDNVTDDVINDIFSKFCLGK